MPEATLTVPGFNAGEPIRLTGFEAGSGMRAPGGGRSGRLADWSGRFAIGDATLAHELAAHLDRTFEEGHGGTAEIVEAGADGASWRYEGVALRHRGGGAFAFSAFARVRRAAG